MPRRLPVVEVVERYSAQPGCRPTGGPQNCTGLILSIRRKQESQEKRGPKGNTISARKRGNYCACSCHEKLGGRANVQTQNCHTGYDAEVQQKATQLVTPQ